MITLEGPVGRLVEIRFEAPVTVEDVENLVVASQLHAAKIRKRLVSCVDMLRLQVLAPPVADRIAKMLRQRGGAIDRTACLLPREAATLALQIERLHRDAGNPGRRAFRDAAAVETWLGEVLDEAERARLSAFLEEVGARSAA
jgi:hypothetical protein